MGGAGGENPIGGAGGGEDAMGGAGGEDPLVVLVAKVHWRCWR